MARAYRMTGRRRAALRKAQLASARARKSKGGKALKKRYNKWGSQNANGRFATKRQRRVNRAKSAAGAALTVAVVAANVASARNTVKTERATRKKIQANAASYSTAQATRAARARVRRAGFR
jgi:hypothetical protein